MYFSTTLAPLPPPCRRPRAPSRSGVATLALAPFLTPPLLPLLCGWFGSIVQWNLVRKCGQCKLHRWIRYPRVAAEQSSAAAAPGQWGSEAMGRNLEFYSRVLEWNSRFRPIASLPHCPGAAAAEDRSAATRGYLIHNCLRLPISSDHCISKMCEKRRKCKSEVETEK